MKKIFTLLFAVGFITAVNAQSGTRDNHQYDQKVIQQNGQWDNNGNAIAGKNGHYDVNDRYHSINGSYGNSMEMQIARINRKYDFQVQQVRNNFFMGRFQKMRTIRSLEAQRQQEIRMVYATSKNRGWDHDRGYDSNHRY
jgi:hypothetical protein